MRRGADPNTQNKMGNTALHMAREYDYFWTARLLIANKADLAVENGEGHPANKGIEGEISETDGMPALASARTVAQVDEALTMLEAQRGLDKAALVMNGMGVKMEQAALWTDTVDRRFKALLATL